MIDPLSEPSTVSSTGASAAPADGQTSVPSGELATEQSDPRYAQIDRLPTEQIARLMNQADAAVPAAVAVVIPAISAAIDAISARMGSGGRLLYVGAGTSGRLAVLDASECPPTFGTEPELVQGVIAGGPDALTRSVEGAEDDAEAGAADLARLEVGPLDSVVGVSASGRAPFVLGALAEARRRGALTVGLSCNDGAPLSAAAEHAIEVVVGPEVVAGSTRLKAGTAQKLVLNMISTIAMVRLGRTYGNRMIEMSAMNSKLADRAVRMVSDITGTDRETAARAVDEAGGQAKTAVVMIRHGLDAEGARALLESHGERLSDALSG
ncbi:N-acetylmuramic acid 6-phosphate etherase [Nonomuraea sp. 3-1Str]|uniref:N-acetylmuramic acid 6-phosphate etherase n=1 Tax=Nonomuraea sp. 3-1Str TaxID=2929801 RepID=UPI002864F51C|nr:N-acetylmuramic acid 6-phosphate etherase [Nonomuraea sp. 3-1Str]MDR8413343.1 N-acetylmuramic acid 6-phosphate etherase [Nonomuraea sp. 3-1Str]